MPVINLERPLVDLHTTRSLVKPFEVESCSDSDPSRTPNQYETYFFGVKKSFIAA